MVSKVAVAKKEIEFGFDLNALQMPAELLNHPVLQGVSPQTLTALSARFDVVKAPRGATLFQVESVAHTIYLVASGTIRTIHRNESGETLESAWMTGFSAIGVGEMLSRTELMQEAAQVAEPAIIYTLPLQLMRELAQKDAVLLMNLAKILASRHMQGLRNERQLLESAFVRVAEFLATLVSREGTQVAPDLYQIKVTQDDIAASTGLNPRTVSRAMKVLQKKGRLYIRRGEYLVREPITLAAAVADAE